MHSKCSICATESEHRCAMGMCAEQHASASVAIVTQVVLLRLRLTAVPHSISASPMALDRPALHNILEGLRDYVKHAGPMDILSRGRLLVTDIETPQKLKNEANRDAMQAVFNSCAEFAHAPTLGTCMASLQHLNETEFNFRLWPKGFDKCDTYRADAKEMLRMWRAARRRKSSLQLDSQLAGSGDSQFAEPETQDAPEPKTQDAPAEPAPAEPADVAPIVDAAFGEEEWWPTPKWADTQLHGHALGVKAMQGLPHKYIWPDHRNFLDTCVFQFPVPAG